jgi:hypothetical protein
MRLYNRFCYRSTILRRSLGSYHISSRSRHFLEKFFSRSIVDYVALRAG